MLIFHLENSFSKPGDKTERAQNFEELHAKFNELKGKKLSYKDKLVKKGLKNRITKKAKREERLMQKKLVRTQRMAAESPKIKEDPEAPKAPKQKPIFNSQGNMVFSKFDFSEIGTKKKQTKTEKDPKKILQQLEEKKKKIKELEAAGEKEKAQEIKEKEVWKAALAKATGEKVSIKKLNAINLDLKFVILFTVIKNSLEIKSIQILKINLTKSN